MEQKLITFLKVCELMNYHAAAEALHLTQPAVSKQIQSLEQIFQTRLFEYNGRRLAKTESGLLLEGYAASMLYNYQELSLAIERKKRTKLRIGATKSIGDYLLGDCVAAYLKDPAAEIELLVDNTQQLLQRIDRNELDFAAVEGPFSRKKYDYLVLKKEPFVGLCSAAHRFNGKEISLEDLFSESLLVREEGSGTLRILEKRLEEAGYALTDFARVNRMNTFPLIRHLVRKNIGISFAYQAVAAQDPQIGLFTVPPITDAHEFCVVFTKGTAARDYARHFFRFPLG